MTLWSYAHFSYKAIAMHTLHAYNYSSILYNVVTDGNSALAVHGYIMLQSYCMGQFMLYNDFNLHDLSTL